MATSVDVVRLRIALSTFAIASFTCLVLKYMAKRSQTTNAFKNVQLKQWAKSGQYLNWNGYAIFYIHHINKQCKANNTLLMVHGYPTHSFDFKQVMNKLIASNKFSQIILYDQIGHGFSDKPSNKTFNYSVHRQVDLLQSLIRYLNLRQFHIMAHDLGDTVIQEFMSRIIDKRKENKGSGIVIKSICFLNGGLIPTVYRPLFMQKLCINPLTKPIIIHLFNQWSFKRSIAKIWGKRIALRNDIIEQMWLAMTYKNGVGPLVNILRYMKERKKFCDRWINSLIQSSEELKIPMILINGLLDPISGKHVAEKFEELVPNATVIKLKDVGHWPNIEAPDDVSQQYLTFLASQ